MKNIARRGSEMIRGLIVLAAVASWPVLGWTEALSDQQIAEIVVRESRAAYYATGRPCACPDDLPRNGSRCGARSAYLRPGGASPLCYVSDVTKAQIEAYKARAR
jgi:hypothetical protein